MQEVIKTSTFFSRKIFMKSISNDKYLEDEEQWHNGNLADTSLESGGQKDTIKKDWTVVPSLKKYMKLKNKDPGVMSKENSSKNC